MNEYKEIQLGGKRGGIALVSEEDYDMLNGYGWYESSGYAMCNSYKNNESSLMHRLIMKPKDNEMVDHINNNKLDNRRENLRICSVTVNNLNRRKTKNASSQYKGVYFDKGRNKYVAQISNHGKTHSVGNFKNEVDAAEQIDKFVLFNEWDYIKLNFPNKKKEYEKNPYVPKIKNNKYTGVNKNRQKYNCTVRVNGKNVYLGTFDDELTAAKAYDEYIVKNNVPDKNLNFSDQHPNYNKDIKVIKSEFIKTNDKNIIKVKMSNEDGYTLIDKKDYDKMKHYACHLSKKDGYVKISVNRKCIPLHRFLMGVTDSKVYVDHINSDRLNNTRANLRLSNAKLNAQNTSKKGGGNSSSKYIGVYYYNKSKKWISRTFNENKIIFYCQSISEKVVAVKRDLFILDNPQYHYKLNFKWDKEMTKLWREFIELDDQIYKLLNCGTSKYIGVSFDNKTKKWTSKVWSGKKKNNIFCCFNEDEKIAAIRRDLFLLDNPQYNNKLNFDWTKKKLKKWRKCIELENKSRQGTSQYMGVCYDKKAKKWTTKIFDTKQNKIVFYYHSKNEKIVARKWDLFLLENRQYKKQMNFKWTKGKLKMWKEFFELDNEIFGLIRKRL